MMIRIYFITLLFLGMMLNSISLAYANDKQIIWATDNWPGISDNDNALYSTLLKEIFASQGYKVKKIVIPFKRAIAFVDHHKADFTGGIVKEIIPSSLHTQAPFPVLVSPVLAFYRKSTITEKDMDISDLARYRVVASPQIGRSIGLNDVYEVTNKVQAFLMVAKGRADIYIDNEGELLGTVSNNVSRAVGYDADLFETTLVGYSSWYMIAPKSRRGETIMQAYIAGTISLLNNGKIEKIYKERGFIVPPDLIKYAAGLKH